MPPTILFYPRQRVWPFITFWRGVLTFHIVGPHGPTLQHPLRVVVRRVVPVDVPGDVERPRSLKTARWHSQYHSSSESYLESVRPRHPHQKLKCPIGGTSSHGKRPDFHLSVTVLGVGTVIRAEREGSDLSGGRRSPSIVVPPDADPRAKDERFRPDSSIEPDSRERVSPVHDAFHLVSAGRSI